MHPIFVHFAQVPPPSLEFLLNFIKILLFPRDVGEFIFILGAKRFDFPGKNHYNTVIIIALEVGYALFAFCDGTH